MNDFTKSADIKTSTRDLLSRCLSIDLEVTPKTAAIFDFAAVRHDGSVVVRATPKTLEQDLDRLEAAIEAIAFPIGHNFLHHDLAHLTANRPRLARLMQAPIDTLWLNPLAFPRNPYHHLVKHYTDGRLQAGHVNDPALDAKLVFEVLSNQLDAFAVLNAQSPEALMAYHWLSTLGDLSAGFDAVFCAVRGAQVPTQAQAFAAIRQLLGGTVCLHRLEQTLGRLADPKIGWPMAYALSWISVAGGESVMPPWVRAQFKEASLIVRHLRDTSCKQPDCVWCAEKNDPVAALRHWFGFEAFRPQPVDDAGRPLQERIVDEVMAGGNVLGILPTGTGKSLCYQIPALSKFDKIGALSVVISPLVALMADQVQGMERAGISSSVTINGMMSMPERQDALDKVRLGDASILIISPEQLRSSSIRS